LDSGMAENKSSDSGEKSAYAEGDEAALDDKGALKPCEACGGDFAPLGLRAFVQTVDDGEVFKTGSGATAAIALCMNCGLMRFHYVNLLRGEIDDAAG
jgi:hypothetical protein